MSGEICTSVFELVGLVESRLFKILVDLRLLRVA